MLLYIASRQLVRAFADALQIIDNGMTHNLFDTNASQVSVPAINSSMLRMASIINPSLTGSFTLSLINQIFILLRRSDGERFEVTVFNQIDLSVDLFLDIKLEPDNVQ